MSEDEFYNSTLRNLSLRIQGHFKQEEERQKAEFERMRVLAYHTVAPYMKKKQSIDKFMPFDWDKGPELPTAEDKEAIRRMFGVKLDSKGKRIA